MDTQIRERPKNSGFAISSLILGIVGFIIFGIIAGTLAIVFGGIAISKIIKYPYKYKGKGMAIAGLVMGIVDIVSFVILLLLFPEICLV